jgi:hypothetical protein
MLEMLKEALLASSDLKGKITIEGDCWRWHGDGGDFCGFYAGDLMYACARGLIGRGGMIEKCLVNEWCVNPWHRRVKYTKVEKTECRRGHQLVEGKCKECWRIEKAEWRRKNER